MGSKPHGGGRGLVFACSWWRYTIPRDTRWPGLLVSVTDLHLPPVKESEKSHKICVTPLPLRVPNQEQTSDQTRLCQSSGPTSTPEEWHGRQIRARRTASAHHQGSATNGGAHRAHPPRPVPPSVLLRLAWRFTGRIHETIRTSTTGSWTLRSMVPA